MTTHELGEKGGISLSTQDFFKELISIGSKKQHGLSVYKVNFDPELFVQLVQEEDSPYKILPSSDGLVAKVKEVPEVGKPKTVDFSHQSGFFDLHKDGLYYPQLPNLAILHCKNQGTADIPTFFVDTKRIVERLEPEDMEALKKLELVYIKKDGSVHIRSFIEAHSQTGEPVINLGSTRTYVRPKLENLASISAREATRVVNTVFNLADESVARQHKWQTGDLVVFDNERYVHGRGLPLFHDTQTKDVTRELNRIWLSYK